MKIPIPYKVILKKLYDKSFENRIAVREARKILTFYYRIPRNLLTSCLNEMEKNKWICFDNFQTIRFMIKVNGEQVYNKKERAFFLEISEITKINN